MTRLATICLLTWIVGSYADGNDTIADLRTAEMPAQHREFFARYCLDCHSSDAVEGGVDLESIPLNVSGDIETADLWQKVLNAINSGEMPPEDADPIRDEDKSAFLEELTAQMVTARKILSDSGGVIPLRRLNRREYVNTIEDLLGVRPNVSSLPDDQSGAGFDTQGASLFFSSDQLENYLASANQALRLCLLAGKPTKATTRRVEPEESYNDHYRTYLAKIKDEYKRAQAWKAQSEKPPSAFGMLDEYQAKKRLEQYLNWGPQLEWYLDQPETKTGAITIMTIKAGGYTRIKLPTLYATAPGKYTVRFRAAHYPKAKKRFHYIELTSGTGSDRKHLAWRKVTATMDKPGIYEFDYDHQPGQKVQLMLMQRSHQDRGDKNLWTLDQQANGIGTIPGVWIDWAEVIGPETDDRITNAANRILIDRPVDQVAAETLGRQTRFTSIQLCAKGANSDGHGPGSSLAWNRFGKPVAGLDTPVAAFHRLFSDDNTPLAQRQANLQKQRSVLDTVTENAKSVSRKIGKQDQQKLTEYLQSVREIEVRLAKEESWLGIEKKKPAREINEPGASLEGVEEIRMMYDIMVAAMQVDATRVFTYRMPGNSMIQSQGATMTAHSMSHYSAGERRTVSQKRDIGHAKLLSEFMDKLKASEEPDGSSLLDNIAITLGTNLSSVHTLTNCPTLIAGGGAGFKQGRHLVMDDPKTPLCNLWLSILHGIGVNADRHGDSTGRIEQLFQT